VDRALSFVNVLSTWTGKAFAWCILILTFGVSYEVFMRYMLNAPTRWSYDIMYMMYGALFLMAGPYTVSRDGMVRADFVYRFWRPRVQATVDLVLFLVFYMPGVGALLWAGFRFASQSWRFGETSIFSPARIPIYPMKTLIPIAGALLLLQGLYEIWRCIVCIRTGAWPPRPHDVEEIETAILHDREAREKLAAGGEIPGEVAK
jgi:TRAP-type mannitol/chloroaromatic compound transport system permease small subunit